MKSNYSLDDLRCFCNVAHFASFKDAAAALKMPLSTLSRRVSQLEKDLQLRLLHRDAHRVMLTNIGEQYFQRSHALFAELDNLNEDLHRDKHQPQGKIRISAPVNAGIHYLRAIFYDFMQQYPDIQLDIRFSNSLIDIEAEGIDVVFRVGSPIVEHWIARPLKDIHFILCAHANYPHEMIDHPQALNDHPLIICHPMTPWRLAELNSGEVLDYYPQQNVRLELDEIQMLVQAIKAGFGIGYVPDYFATRMIANGELAHVLPQWRSQARTLFLLYRDREQLPLRVRLLIEFVLQRFVELSH